MSQLCTIQVWANNEAVRVNVVLFFVDANFVRIISYALNPKTLDDQKTEHFFNCLGKQHKLPMTSS